MFQFAMKSFRIHTRFKSMLRGRLRGLTDLYSDHIVLCDRSVPGSIPISGPMLHVKPLSYPEASLSTTPGNHGCRVGYSGRALEILSKEYIGVPVPRGGFSPHQNRLVSWCLWATTTSVVPLCSMPSHSQTANCSDRPAPVCEIQADRWPRWTNKQSDGYKTIRAYAI